MTEYTGHLHKMHTQLVDGKAQYELTLNGDALAMHEYIGRTVHIEFLDEIHCVACGRLTKKSFQNGYCFPCTQRLAQCDLCIVKPERCHHHLGTCREPEWGDQHCMQAHYVYLANSSGIKVGITRGSNIPHRWIDQGASQALPIAQVATRRISGLLEVAIAQHVNDKTNWRKMLKGSPEPVDLPALRDQLLAQVQTEIATIQQDHGEEALILLPDEAVVDITYPVEQYLEKITSMNLDKTPTFSGMLLGIKGQYLIFDCGVMNVRKFAGYHVRLSV